MKSHKQNTEIFRQTARLTDRIVNRLGWSPRAEVLAARLIRVRRYARKAKHENFMYGLQLNR